MDEDRVDELLSDIRKIETTLIRSASEQEWSSSIAALDRIKDMLLREKTRLILERKHPFTCADCPGEWITQKGYLLHRYRDHSDEQAGLQLTALELSLL